MSNKVLLICVAAMLVIGLVVGGCGPATPPEEAPPEEAPPEEAPPEVIELRYHSADPAISAVSVHGTIPWWEKIEKATSGRVKITFYWSSTLCPWGTEWECIKSGVADIGEVVTNFSPGLVPLTEALNLPGTPVTTGQQAGAVHWKLYENIPELREEYKDLHVLFFKPYFMYVMTKDKEVRTPADLKGLKLRGAGAMIDLAKSVGAVPVSFSYAEIYSALEKGIIDGNFTCYESVQVMHYAEVAKYFLEQPIMTNMTHTVAMNLDTWNSLPPDIQDIITACCGMDATTWFGQFSDNYFQMLARDDIEEEGLDFHFTQITPEERAQWDEAFAPLWDEWLDRVNAKGLPGQEVIDEMYRLAEEYKWL